jgi:hypothetical protein
VPQDTDVIPTECDIHCTVTYCMVQSLYFQFVQQQALDPIPKNYTKKETRDANFIYLVTCSSSSSGVHEENSMSVLISISSL